MQFDNSGQFFVPGTHPIPAPKPAKTRKARYHRKRGHVVHRAAGGHHFHGHIVFRGSRMEIRF